MKRIINLIKKRLQCINKLSLVSQIGVGLFLGVLLAYFSPENALSTEIIGTLFTKALQAVAPILVFILIMASISRYQSHTFDNIRPILILYLLGTFFAALTAVIASYLFPSNIPISHELINDIGILPPQKVSQVFSSLLFNITDNPFNAMIKGNYMCLLVWGIILGYALRHASPTTKQVIDDIANSITYLVKIVIRFAPIGIFGIVASTLASVGFDKLQNYFHLIFVLLGCMLFVVFVVNPILIYYRTRKNPYPLILLTLRESAIPAFFTRSSAANIPVNLTLCKKLELPKDVYSISIPLGANINMAGAAITITVLTLAAVHTLGIETDIFTALLLSIIASICACGASGVAGGSLLLIPIACSLFGIPDYIAMSVVSTGFAISIIQDSAETAVNSSVDVAFTAAGCASK